MNRLHAKVWQPGRLVLAGHKFGAVGVQHIYCDQSALFTVTMLERHT